MSGDRVVVVGSVAFTATCIRALYDATLAPIAVLGRRDAAGNADFVDVVELAQKLGLRAEYVDRLSTAAEADLVTTLRPDVLLVLGWSYLVPARVRRAARIAVGSHPAPLPLGRGRNPISWAIALGLPATALTLFELDDEPDAGPILWQRAIPIQETDDAGTVYAAIEALARDAIPDLVRGLARGIVTPAPQDPTRAVTWRRRTNADRTIDWRMSGRSIDRLVRSITRPYVGAWAYLNGEPYRIWRVAVRPLDPAWASIEPGRVISRSGRTVTVRCDDGAVDVVDHELPDVPVASYL